MLAPQYLLLLVSHELLRKSSIPSQTWGSKKKQSWEQIKILIKLKYKQIFYLKCGYPFIDLFYKNLLRKLDLKKLSESQRMDFSRKSKEL